MAMKKPTAKQKGLKKLPSAVRNKMGFMKNGGMSKMKKKGYANGGMKKKGYVKGGMPKKKVGMKNGGMSKMKKKGMARGGAVKKKR